MSQPAASYNSNCRGVSGSGQLQATDRRATKAAGHLTHLSLQLLRICLLLKDEGLHLTCHCLLLPGYLLYDCCLCFVLFSLGQK